MSSPAFSGGAKLTGFARGLTSEGAFDVLAVARKLKADGKDVIELQIGDSPFPSTSHARTAGIRAIEENATHYGPSPGLPSFRETIAANYQEEFGIPIGPENVIVGPGAKIFEQLFCEAFIEAGDEVLVFSPHFPTYGPNIERRGGRMLLSALQESNQFRPNLNDVEAFVKRTTRPRGIFLNSPHNPTGGVATAEDLAAIGDLVRGRDIAVFSDEPYCHMAWQTRHVPLLKVPGLIEQTIAAYTFSKSYSMSGWRLGYAITSARIAEPMSKMLNTTISCVPPFVQMAGQAALRSDREERDVVMAKFQQKVALLVDALQKVPDVTVSMPPGTFYVFPNVAKICARTQLTSHGLAMYLLEGADDQRGVACLGGECFGAAGQGFIRFSCAEPDDRLVSAIEFFAEAVTREDRIKTYRASHPQYHLPT
ncbi:pyridoxal phosphate-dependent aminotransferase [soil metagenome]